MMQFVKELGQAAVLTVLFFGPIFYYILFMMKP